MYMFETKEILQIEEMLRSPDHRRELIEYFLSEGEFELAMKIRFFGVLFEFEKINPNNTKERNKKAMKIIEAFFQNDSLFKVTGIPYFCEIELLKVSNGSNKGQFEAFKLIKNIFLQDLAQVPLIVRNFL